MIVNYNLHTEIYIVVTIKVNPRDCLPKDEIRGNIKTNFKKINKWLGKFPIHDY